MPVYSFAHLSDRTLVQHAKTVARRQRQDTAELIACIAEIDARKIHVTDGYSSLYTWVRGELNLSEGSAYKHIYAARAARRFPSIFPAVANGRLHLSAVVLLAAHLTEDTRDLLASAEGKTKTEIELLLARRFPKPDLPTVIESVARTPAALQLSPGTVGTEPGRAVSMTAAPAETVRSAVAPAPVAPPRMVPLAPERYALQTTIDQETSDLLREAQDLLGHLGSSHVPDVLKNALRQYVERLRKQKFGATDAPRPGRERNPNSRHIPEEVKRAVWARDCGQCAYKSANGHRCEERSGLEYDHVVPYARGGDMSVSNIRLLCLAHNQFEADRSYGPEFMKQKRDARRRSA